LAEPHFFVDRSLGRKQVPERLRQDGWLLITLSERYGIPEDEAILDVDWLRLAGVRGWPVLMKDERIRYRPSERAALVTFDVRAFCLTSGNLTGQAMADLFVVHREGIWDRARGSGAALFAVSRSGLRDVELGP